MRKLASLSCSLLLAVAVAVAGCNDGGVVGAPSEDIPEETPEPTPTAEPEPEPTELPPPPPQADLSIVLSWDDLGLDWELHLVKPGGHINDNATGTDCTWTTCIWTSPDWGVAGDAFDDPHKDYDNTGTQGPERIWLAEPEAGIYHVMVEHWGSGQPESDGSVSIDVGGQVTNVSKENLPSHHVWTVATIEWPSGVVTPSQDVFDCSASWSAGCTAPLP